MIPVKYKAVVPHDSLRPAQQKAIDAGLLDGKSLVIATPTASGKTLIATLALYRSVLAGKKGIYVAPLKALASEKAREFTQYPFTSALTIGDFDAVDSDLSSYDVIITTPEKLDSLMRHTAPWISSIGTVVVDEVHLLGDTSRGPTLELLITLLRRVLKDAQFIALSATIRNSDEIASWLNATLIQDNWRPVELKEAISTPEGLIYKK